VQKLVIEARVNEYAMRDQNPNVPWLPEEIARDGAECRDAGAAILHWHGRKADGSPEFSYENFRDTIAAARELSDILIHPTLGYGREDTSAEGRIANTLRLARDPATKPDFAPMDMGSTNVDWYDPAARTYTTRGQIYTNGTDTLEHFARAFRSSGITPYLVAWNVAFTRQIGAFLDAGLVGAPAYVCLTMTEGSMLAGHPSTPDGLDAHTRFLPRNHRVEWTGCSFNANIMDLAEKIITEGGHISIGLGDWAYAEDGCPTNAEVIRKLVDLSRSLGRDVATPAEARTILGVQDPLPVGVAAAVGTAA
jgi:uncharacterized protein (DUF849 family)